jgi:hypothetical protein
MMRKSFSLVWKLQCIWTTNGCRTRAMMACSTSMLSTYPVFRLSNRFEMIFMAWIVPVDLFRTCSTLPKLPIPITLSSSKSLGET